MRASFVARLCAAAWAVCVVAGAAPGQGGTLYALHFDSSELYAIDAASSQVTHVGFTGIAAPGSLAMGQDGQLYTVSTGANPLLWRVDPQTAQAQQLGALNVGFVFEGALAFDRDGVLWGACAGSADDPRLFRIPGPGSQAFLGPRVAGAQRDLNGMDFRADGLLVALDRASAALIVVDPWTGAARELAPLQAIAGASGGLAIEGCEGWLVAGPANPDLPGPVARTLWGFDPFTGAQWQGAPLSPPIEGFDGLGGLAGDGAAALCTIGCTGDGSGAWCPCGNLGAVDAGCANSLGGGCLLFGAGVPAVVEDALRLHGVGAPPGRAAVFLQGQAAPPALFRDGLLCLGAPLLRLEHATVDAQGLVSTSVPLAAAGGVASGTRARYQLWYRDAAGPCATGSNLSNELLVDWR